MIADLCERLACLLELAEARRTSARVRPAPNAPIWRKFRRWTPSQYDGDEPRKRSMIRSGNATRTGWEKGAGQGVWATNKIFTSGRRGVNRKTEDRRQVNVLAACGVATDATPQAAPL